MTKRLLTVEQVAKILNVQQNTVYRWIRAGKLLSIKIGSLRRVDEEALDEFLTIGPEDEKKLFRPSSPDDPFLKLIGSGESGRNDISARHDDYLAERHRS